VRYRAYGTVILKNRFITEVMGTVYEFYLTVHGVLRLPMIFPNGKKLFFQR